MLIVGSDDGIYRTDTLESATAATAKKVHDTGRVLRVREFPEHQGVFAATKTGLYHSTDGNEWTDLNVPQEQVYSVGCRSRDQTLFAGTRPAHVFVADTADRTPPYQDLEWEEIDAFRDRAERNEWQLPRHENTAQVRDVLIPSETHDRILTGIEVGGVHVSDDGGDSWRKCEGADDDIHELHVIGPDEFVAATGFGLFYTENAGESWTRLDTDYDQRYFRAVFSVDDTVYAAGALKNSSTWDDDDADPELFISSNGEMIEPVAHPYPTETVTGIASVDGSALVATHRGNVLRERSDGWERVGSFPVPEQTTGRYTPLLWVDS